MSVAAYLIKDEYEDGDDQIRTATRRWRVESTTDDITAAHALAASGIPLKGDGHPGDSGCRCVRRHASLSDNNFIWFVDASYSSEQDEAAQSSDNPGEWEPQWDYAEARHTKFVYVDADGQFMLNTAGDPLPPYEIEYGGLQVSFTRWVTIDNFDALAEGSDILFHVNANQWGEFNEWDPDTAYCTGFRAPIIKVNGVGFRQITMTAIIKCVRDADGNLIEAWNPTYFLNKGFNSRNFFTGKKGPNRNRDGALYSEPQLLTAGGWMCDLDKDGQLDAAELLTIHEVGFNLFPSATFPGI